VALDSYSGLKQSVIDHLDSPELVDFVDDFIDVAEARHRREIRTRAMLVLDTLAINDGDRYVNLPADFLDLKYIRILNPNTGYSARRYLPAVTQMSEHEITEVSTNRPQRPRYFSVNAQIEFDSEADQDYTAEVLYYANITALSGVDTSNQLLIDAPDVYLYSSLSASAPFLLNDERIGTWESLYTSGRDALNMHERKSVRSGPQIVRTKGAI
jgi:hypothetical protein